MTYQDEKDFLEAIRQLGPAKVICNTFADESKMEIPSLQPVGTIANDTNLSLVNQAIDTTIKHKFYQSQSYHCVDCAESEVVQFNRSKPVNAWLANGRLWFDEKINTGEKSMAFLKWANSLLKWIRKNYHRDKAGHYVGPNALKLSTEGRIRLGPTIESSITLEERKRIFGLDGE